MDWFAAQPAPLQALIAGIFTWGVTALGAAGVFLAKRPSQRLLDVMLGFAGGVMIAASYWSLLAPAIEVSEELGYPGWLPPLIGFLAGGGSLRLLDMVMPHLHPAMAETHPDGPPSTLRRTTLLVLAITLHNIPEGLAVGVAFGAIGMLPQATLAGAIALALGMGLQNFPEGLAVSMPLRREGLTRARSFFYGQLSAIVEPIFAFLGALLVYIAHPLLPYALAFAAGAMIFVVVEETVPESQASGNGDLATTGFLIGFAVMMVLDVALG
ncbi:ZIP family metal transporter [Cloacibacillus sp.]|uniref:ZIP family metal transporter n=1 Tax=Cloacibacillus sp. TaxID=2049023 RepID=UPI0025B9C4FA|nr:ZIP family metal transporter [Cloacibacillus sp.]MCC8058273.1 ZIP family metal transporter [Cloacibacillus sp.]